MLKKFFSGVAAIAVICLISGVFAYGFVAVGLDYNAVYVSNSTGLVRDCEVLENGKLVRRSAEWYEDHKDQMSFETVWIK